MSDFEEKDLLVNLSLTITRGLTPEKDHDMTDLDILLIISPTTNEDHKFNVTKDERKYIHWRMGEVCFISPHSA